ncbi:helix-turn-helix transcriptional regulator [Chitinophaga rhizosphaerae]|uniref:helix-turn-helix transcriptional regulator n=1 Tax=Chitinophaga rhizosphaerae TaxID=1864947 RepID=UPI000F805FDA|nr:helix-turn-helix transcriptional regulator [Chitinophaga rhizosphaerae]
MPFAYFLPGAALKPYIQSYWTLKGNDDTYDILYPDGCIDMIVNLGGKFVVTQKGVVLEERGVYLGGALTEAIYEKIPAGVYLLGVRFAPGCFGHFYPSRLLSDLRDDCIQVNSEFAPPTQELLQDPITALDGFYTEKLADFHHPVKDAAAKILQSGGNATLNEIAAICRKSPRQTERIFKQHIGLTPKQFCRIVKYSCTQELLAARAPEETILAIALAAGYYDHAHLAREYKRISRWTPSGK